MQAEYETIIMQSITVSSSGASSAVTTSVRTADDTVVLAVAIATVSPGSSLSM